MKEKEAKSKKKEKEEENKTKKERDNLETWKKRNKKPEIESYYKYG